MRPSTRGPRAYGTTSIGIVLLLATACGPSREVDLVRDRVLYQVVIDSIRTAHPQVSAVFPRFILMGADSMSMPGHEREHYGAIIPALVRGEAGLRGVSICPDMVTLATCDDVDGFAALSAPEAVPGGARLSATVVEGLRRRPVTLAYYRVRLERTASSGWTAHLQILDWEETGIRW